MPFTALAGVRCRGGEVTSEDGVLRVTGADAATLLIAAGTSYVGWR
ncbi:hypothetical protein [Streptomyces sp. 8K308]